MDDQLRLPIFAGIITYILFMIFVNNSEKMSTYHNNIMIIFISFTFGLVGSSFSNYYQSKMLFKNRKDIIGSMPVDKVREVLEEKNKDADAAEDELLSSV
jgi:hypothetical protein